MLMSYQVAIESVERLLNPVPSTDNADIQNWTNEHVRF